jgi:dienelactone hydrolase
MRIVLFAHLLCVSLVATCGCGPSASTRVTLAEARKAGTQAQFPAAKGDPVPAPPAGVFQLVKYETAVGQLPAYVTIDPKDGKKHPAIVWITGGDCNSIGDIWSIPEDPNDDQTARQYRQAGLVLMAPSLRGGNDNPGQKEGFFGEVDDILAAAKWLAARPYVDPKRIYLGGHSTGGTMALLVAEVENPFRAVFAFGPVGDVSGYGADSLPPGLTDAKEIELRSPGHWLASIQKPTWVIEGASKGNVQALREMAAESKNAAVVFVEVPNATHFSVLAPVNEYIASKLAEDDGSKPAPDITAAAIRVAVQK